MTRGCRVRCRGDACDLGGHVGCATSGVYVTWGPHWRIERGDGRIGRRGGMGVHDVAGHIGHAVSGTGGPCVTWLHTM